MDRPEREKMLSGELYHPSDPRIQDDLAATARWLARYNASLPEERPSLLRERLGAVGERAEICPPFFCDYGFNIRLGHGVFLNFNCVILDVVEVTIGDGTQIGPAVHTRPIILEMPRSGSQGLSSGVRFGSAGMCGLAAPRLFFQALSSATTRLSARAAL